MNKNRIAQMKAYCEERDGYFVQALFKHEDYERTGLRFYTNDVDHVTALADASEEFAIGNFGYWTRPGWMGTSGFIAHESMTVELEREIEGEDDQPFYKVYLQPQAERGNGVKPLEIYIASVEVLQL